MLIRSLLLALVALAGCRSAYPVNPDTTVDSVYLIEMPDILSGTAWTAADGVVVTAGHVCAADVPYVLTDRAGRHFPAVILARSEVYDLCALVAPVHTPPLRVAETNPEWGRRLFYVGAPLGAFGDGVAPTYYGNYVGNWTVTTPATHGASGSAVLDSDGVIGVLVSTHSDTFDGLLNVESREHLLDFLDSLPAVSH